jgi:hypothetical protein
MWSEADLRRKRQTHDVIDPADRAGSSEPPAEPVQARAQEAVPAYRSKTEARYAARLDARDDVARWYYEPASWRIGDGRHYRPDFLVILDDARVQMHEVKGGYIRDRALVKPHAAAALYPAFDWIVVQQERAGAEWQTIFHAPNRP